MKKNSDILNKLRYETENANVIHLWLEGMFWKAYERSAYLFVHRISEYKPYKKFIRAVGGEVVAIGFPSKKLEKLLEGRSVEYIDDKHYILNGFTVDTKELRDFQSWKKGVPAFPYHMVVSNEQTASVSESKVQEETQPEKPIVVQNIIAPKDNKMICPPAVNALLGDIRRFRMESATSTGMHDVSGTNHKKNIRNRFYLDKLNKPATLFWNQIPTQHTYTHIMWPALLFFPNNF